MPATASTTQHYVELRVDDDSYAAASSAAYQRAEENATSYPVVYPEPFNTIGCGWGRMTDHVEQLAKELADETGLDWDCCRQTTLQLTLYCGTPDIYAQFDRALAERLRPLIAWVASKSAW